MRSVVMSVLILSAVGCSSAASEDPPSDAGVVVPDAGPDPLAHCPGTSPADGEPCDAAGFCGYLECDAAGVVRATCDGATWSVDAEPCGPIDCRGTTCDAGQICVINVGGAVIPFCNPAPEGPVSCQSVCGAPCVETIGPSDPPERFQCNTCFAPMCA